MKAALRVTQLESRETPSATAGPDVSHGHNNTGQHGAAVAPQVVRGENNRPDVIFMPVQAHGGTAPANSGSGNGPTKVWDTVPNDQQIF
jgi:hypothetical protein